MKNYLEILDKILYTDLVPWHENNQPDDKFFTEIDNIKTAEPEYIQKYSIDFQRPFNNKTKYYNKLITNEVISTCNTIHQLIKEDDNIKLHKYWRNEILNKKLTTRLKDIGKIIKNRNYDISHINPHKAYSDLDADHKTETYIMQLLKVAFMWLYLEIQEMYKFINDKDLLIQEDLYTSYLSEPIPEKLFIKQQQSNIKIKAQKKSSKLHGAQHTSFRYKQYIKAPGKLTDLYNSLKKSGFISEDTSIHNFKRIFSGNEVDTPIKWTGNKSEFHYFIQLICLKYDLLEDLKQKHFIVACKCFVQNDNTPFDRKKLRTLKVPKLTEDILEKAVKLLI